MSTIRGLPLAVAVALALLPGGSAFATPKVDGVFALPGVMTNGQLTVGPDSNVWVALEQAVGRVKPDGAVTEFTTGGLGGSVGLPTGGITSAGGFVWVSQPASIGQETIVKIPPGDPAGATGVPVAGIDAGATAMTTGPDGNIWVALPGKIVKFSPANPAAATTYTVTGLSPKAITASTDGTLWLTDTLNGGRLLNVTTAGATTPYTVGGGPQFVGAGPGGQVAFGNPLSDPQQIGRLLPGGAPLTIDRGTAGSDPFGVTFGADGAFWIAEFAGNRLARVTPDGQLTTLGGLPVVAGQGPRQLTAGPGNTLWVTLDKPGDAGLTKIARVTGVDPPPLPPLPPPPAPVAPIVPPTPTIDLTAPRITKAKLSRTTVAVGVKSVTLRFVLSEAGDARLVLSRRLAGRRRGKACLRPTPKLRRAKSCTRRVRVKTISFAGKSGANAIRLSLKARAAGRYSATLTVTDAAGNRAAVTRTLRIRGKQKRR